MSVDVIHLSIHEVIEPYNLMEPGGGLILGVDIWSDNPFVGSLGEFGRYDRLMYRFVRLER
ncbi:hypothetical protein [Phaffia rhodozyma]|uniref:Uncharacterized protein n=1 Tax=Phaffia rhodozyma TaxID=264483 RepID=A0A0F7SRD5_PHARH|nr:hypothetical protein [Phaffia rhodozyma]